MLWLLVGIIGFFALAGSQLAGDLGYDVLMIPAMLLSKVGIQKGVLIDDAHGPPFLTMSGIYLVYVLPGLAVFLIIWMRRIRKS